jgi:hypothetical protein
MMKTAKSFRVVGENFGGGSGRHLMGNIRRDFDIKFGSIFVEERIEI